MRAHRGRIEPLEDLARAYLAEANAVGDEDAAKGLRRHAHFAQKFVSLTKKEIRSLERELQRTELEASVADARSRGEPPTLQNVQESVARHRKRPPASPRRRPRAGRREGR
jgi:hypothetical protein